MSLPKHGEREKYIMKNFIILTETDNFQEVANFICEHSSYFGEAPKYLIINAGQQRITKARLEKFLSKQKPNADSKIINTKSSDILKTLANKINAINSFEEIFIGIYISDKSNITMSKLSSYLKENQNIQVINIRKIYKHWI